MVLNVLRKTLKDINNNMETQEIKDPYKIIKMNSGDDVICKIVMEYDDVFVFERPMSLVKNSFVNDEGEPVEHTQLSKWITYTNDIHIFVPKNKVQAIATLAPEVTYFYKKSLLKMAKEEAHQPKTEEEVHNRIQKMEETFAELTRREGDDNILPFERTDKDKLH